MSMDHVWNEDDKGNLKHSEKTLSQCHVAQHKCHTDWSGIEPWPVSLHILLISGLLIWLQFYYNISNFCLPLMRYGLSTGERYDIIISADQAESSYWIVVRGHHQCENLHQEALLVYDGAAVLHEFNETTKSSLKVCKPYFVNPPSL